MFLVLLLGGMGWKCPIIVQKQRSAWWGTQVSLLLYISSTFTTNEYHPPPIYQKLQPNNTLIIWLTFMPTDKGVKMSMQH